MATGKHEWDERLDGIYYEGKKARTRDIVAFLHRLSKARRPMFEPEILLGISEEIESEFPGGDDE